MEEFKLNRKSGISRLGKSYVWYSNGKISLSLGPDWPYNLCLLSLILSAFILNIMFMAPQVDPSLQFIGFFIMTWVLVSYLGTALKNPGILVSEDEIELESIEDKAYCQDCHIHMAKTTEHCEDCGLCCEEYDHHCPLSGKCIGKGNLYFFYSFLFSIFGFFAYFMIWTFYAAQNHFENTIKIN